MRIIICELVDAYFNERFITATPCKMYAFIITQFPKEKSLRKQVFRTPAMSRFLGSLREQVFMEVCVSRFYGSLRLIFPLC